MNMKDSFHWTFTFPPLYFSPPNLVFSIVKLFANFRSHENFLCNLVRFVLIFGGITAPLSGVGVRVDLV